MRPVIQARPFALALALVACAGGLRAQTLPVPELPPDPDAAAAPEAPPTALQPAGTQLPAAVPVVRARRWDYTTSVGVLWDRNVGFFAPDGPSDVALIPRATLSRLFTGSRSTLRASLAGRYYEYREQDAQSRGYADVLLDWGYRSSPNTTWRAGGSYMFGHSDASQPLQAQGVLLPLVGTQTATGAAGVTRQFGTRTSLLIDGRYYRTDFDSAELIDGESARGTIALERKFSTRNTVALVYSAEDVLKDPLGRAYLTHYGSLQWTRVVSPRTAVLLEGGASYTPEAGRAQLERKEAFFGGASLVRQLGRSSLTLFVRREVAPAFGAGVSRLELRSGLSTAAPLGRDWLLRLAAAYAWSDSPEDQALAYPSGGDGSAALSYRISSRLELSGEGVYRRRSSTPTLPAIDTVQAGLFLTLSTPVAREKPPVP
jgi:hypothetical protein